MAMNPVKPRVTIFDRGVPVPVKMLPLTPEPEGAKVEEKAPEVKVAAAHAEESAEHKPEEG